MAKRLARWLPGYSFDDATFFSCDDAPSDIQALRRAAFFNMAQTLQSRHRLSIEATVSAREDIHGVCAEASRNCVEDRHGCIFCGHRWGGNEGERQG
jgi:hypothetical protein